MTIKNVASNPYNQLLVHNVASTFSGKRHDRYGVRIFFPNRERKIRGSLVWFDSTFSSLPFVALCIVTLFICLCFRLWSLDNGLQLSLAE